MRLLRACLLLAGRLLLRPQEEASASAGKVDGKLNVHVVCHTHDDAGWLKVKAFWRFSGVSRDVCGWVWFAQGAVYTADLHYFRWHVVHRRVYLVHERAVCESDLYLPRLCGRCLRAFPPFNVNTPSTVGATYIDVSPETRQVPTLRDYIRCCGIVPRLFTIARTLWMYP